MSRMYMSTTIGRFTVAVGATAYTRQFFGILNEEIGG
jgi:hypothetical protein